MCRYIAQIVFALTVLCSHVALGQQAEPSSAPTPPSTEQRYTPTPNSAAPVAPPVPQPVLPGGAILIEPTTKIEHLVKAAEHLDAAGLNHLAAHARDEAARLRDVLNAKQSELEKLHSEIRQLASSERKQVIVKLQIVEISLTNARILGFDVDTLERHAMCCAKVQPGEDESRPPTAKFPLGHQSCEPQKVSRFINEAVAEDIAKVLAEPVLITVDGRPASFLIGGQVPVPVGVDPSKPPFREIGTDVKISPTILSPQKVRLQLRARLTQLDQTIGTTVGDVKIPGFQVREIDTGLEAESGKTIAVGGPVQLRMVHQKRENGTDAAAPNVVQTLFLVTPQILEARAPAASTVR